MMYLKPKFKPLHGSLPSIPQITNRLLETRPKIFAGPPPYDRFPGQSSRALMMGSGWGGQPGTNKSIDSRSSTPRSISGECSKMPPEIAQAPVRMMMRGCGTASMQRSSGAAIARVIGPVMTMPSACRGKRRIQYRSVPYRNSHCPAHSVPARSRCSSQQRPAEASAMIRNMSGCARTPVAEQCATLHA